MSTKENTKENFKTNRKETSQEITIPDLLPGQDFAAAITTPSPSDQFAAVNQKFSTSFPGIHTPFQLLELITGKSEKKKIISHNQLFWEVMQQELNACQSLFLLKDITSERSILSRLKDQLQELTRFNEIYTKVIDKDLPIGVMIIDKDYNVLMANHMLKRYFHIPPQAHLEKCYNFVKGIKPCDECILRQILEGKRKNKKTFVTSDEHYITAEIHTVDDKFIVTFRDTTKEINLIQEIKKQQDALESANQRINQQNDILKRLSTINIRIAQMRDPEAILETVVKSIIDTFDCEKGAILLFNEGGKIKNAHFTSNIDVQERLVIIDNVGSAKSYPADSLNPRRRYGLSREDHLPDYTIQDIIDKETLVGRLFLKKNREVIDQSIMQLFLMQVNIFLDNLGLQRRLEEMAQTDSLTGVFNRYYFEKRFAEEQELSLRFGQPLSLILADVNGLKETNDQVGHAAGDRLIEQTTRLIGNNISTYDSIYRIGGDEFIILLSNCPEDQMNIVMDMLKDIQESASFEYNGSHYPLRFSLGGACSTSVDYNKMKDEADKRMYRDKDAFYKTHSKYR